MTITQTWICRKYACKEKNRFNVTLHFAYTFQIFEGVLVNNFQFINGRKIKL